jgi:hypothetical protein
MRTKIGMLYVSAIISLIFLANPVYAIHLDSGELTADCDVFSIHVTGRAYTGDNCTVSYVLNFDPALASGSVTGSFDLPPVVSPNPWDYFDETYNGEFGDILCGEYKISGTADLICESDPSRNPFVTLLEKSVVCPCEGCTPGFWKNNAGQITVNKKGKIIREDDNCWCGDYSPDDTLGEVFAGIPPQFADDTLLEALNYKGSSGQEYNMLRHAVAALLNACSDNVSFGLTEEYIINTVIAALNGGDVNAAHNEFAAQNESVIEDACIEGICAISGEECDGEPCGVLHNCPIDSHCNPISLDGVYGANGGNGISKADIKSLMKQHKQNKKARKNRPI